MPEKLRIWALTAARDLRKKLLPAASRSFCAHARGVRPEHNRKTRLLSSAASGTAAALDVLHALGLAQTRCSHCLRPFSPARNPGRDEPLPPVDGPAGQLAPLCPECCTLFAPYTGPRCPRCGLPPSWMRVDAKLSRPFSKGADLPCGRCLNQPPPWDGLAYYGLYQGALRDALLRLKFGGELSLGGLLGACLLEAARCLPRPDVLTAMPQHPAHLRRRGFNQAHELARAVRGLTDLPLRSDLLFRTLQGAPQAGLSARNDTATYGAAFEPRAWPKVCESGSLTM